MGAHSHVPGIIMEFYGSDFQTDGLNAKPVIT